MVACQKNWAIAAFRRLSYIGVIMIPACLPALGCRSEPEPPAEVKSQAVDPEKTPIEDVIDIKIEDLKEYDPNELNDSPKETGAPLDEPAKEK